MTNAPTGAATALAVIARAEGTSLKGKRLANARSVAAALDAHGTRVGLDQPHRLAQFLPQLSIESGGFLYDREIWGPTPAQKRYEGRKDLGNVWPGDGKKFSGRGPIQLTGRDNVTRFRDWCRKTFPGLDVPDFAANPDLINTDPWEGLSAIWYWDAGNPDRRSLNRYADAGDNEMVTRRINGGLTHFDERLAAYCRYALVLLGRDPKDIRGFQKAAGLTVDGIAGPRTRAALHEALVALTSAGARAETVQKAPVVVEKEREVVPPAVETEVKKEERRAWWQWLVALPLTGIATFFRDYPEFAWPAAGGVVVVAVVALIGGRRLVRRVKAIRAEISA